MKAKMKEFICDICEKGRMKEALSIYEPDRFEVALGVSRPNYSRVWMGCNNCGIMKNIMPKENELILDSIGESYYEIDFGNNLSDRFSKIMALNASKSDNHHRVKRVKDFLINWTKKSEKIFALDIGSGLGVFPAKLYSEFGNNIEEITCIEPDPLAAAHLRSLKFLKVKEEVFNAKFVKEKYSFISLNKVLEHVREPLELLENVKKCLAPNGIFYLEVPHRATTDLKEPSDNILGSLHKYLFNNKSLMGMLELVGLDVITVSSIVEPSGKITCFAFSTLDELLLFDS